MTIRDNEPDYVDFGEDGKGFDRAVRAIHRKRPAGHFVPDDVALDTPGGVVLNRLFEPYNSRAKVVDINEFLRHPDAAARVAEAKAECDVYREKSRRLAGL